MKQFFSKLYISLCGAYRGFKEPWLLRPRGLNTKVQFTSIAAEEKPQTLALSDINVVSEVSKGSQHFAQELWSHLDSFIKVQNSLQTKRAYEKDLKVFFAYLEQTQKKMSVHNLLKNIRGAQVHKLRAPQSQMKKRRQNRVMQATRFFTAPW